MNILVIGRFYTEGFALHIAETLSMMGHRVRRFEPGFKSPAFIKPLGKDLQKALALMYSASDNLPAIRTRRVKALWDEVMKGPLDIVIVCHDFLLPAEVADLKRRSAATVVLWFPDAMVRFDRGLFLNAPYDALFFKDPYIVSAIQSVVASPVFYLPECFNPIRHSLPHSDLARDPTYACEITTAGNLHSWRVAFFKNLTAYDVKLWGNPPPWWTAPGPVTRMYQGRAVYNSEKVRAFRGAKIVINNLHCGEVWGVNARCFEVAGAGAFQIVDWRPGVSQLFTEGKELITFRGIDDLKKRIDYWLPRADERQVIGEAGRRRAHNDHTYELRLRLLLDTVAGRESGYEPPLVAYRLVD